MSIIADRSTLPALHNYGVCSLSAYRASQEWRQYPWCCGVFSSLPLLVCWKAPMHSPPGLGLAIWTRQPMTALDAKCNFLALDHMYTAKLLQGITLRPDDS